jgi:glycosyltransferase involved in cell wall biosynthesis
MKVSAARKLKVAFVSQPWDTAMPDAERSSVPIWTGEVARRLAGACPPACPGGRRAFDLTVYALRHGCQAAAELHRGVRYRRLSLAPDRYILRAACRLHRGNDVARPLFASMLYYLGYVVQAAVAMKLARCDVAHVFNCTQFVPVIRALNPGIRIVLDMRCEWLTQLDRQLMAGRIEQADAVISCSHYLTGKSRARFPELAGRFKTIFTGVDTDAFSGLPISLGQAGPPADAAAEAKNGQQVLYVGRGSPEKGVHVLLEAFEEVLARCPQARLDIVGSVSPCPRQFICELSDDPRIGALASFYDGPGYGAGLDSRLNSPLMRQRVRWLGAVPYRQIAGHYRAADVVVNASFSESLGRSLIEAMAAGKPVVATRVGGTTEIVEDGKTGLLVQAGDAAAMAEAICRLLSDGEMRRSMGSSARRRAVELFSWDLVVRRVAGLYEEMHAGRE